MFDYLFTYIFIVLGLICFSSCDLYRSLILL